MNSVNIDISDKCNLTCEYCRQTPGDTEMDLETFRQIVDSHPDIRLFGIGGGEPLLHSRLEDMLYLLLENGKIVNLSTNLVENAHRLVEFFDIPPEDFTLQVSLPGADRSLYEIVTGVDAFEQVLANVYEIKDRISIVFNHVVYRDNIHGAPDMMELSKEMDIPVRINVGYPIGYARKLHVATPDQLQVLADQIQTKIVEGYPIISGIRFKDSSCTDIIVPCSHNSGYFTGEPGICHRDRVYYNQHGERGICEMRG